MRSPLKTEAPVERFLLKQTVFHFGDPAFVQISDKNVQDPSWHLSLQSAISADVSGTYPPL